MTHNNVYFLDYIFKTEVNDRLKIDAHKNTSEINNLLYMLFVTILVDEQDILPQKGSMFAMKTYFFRNSCSSQCHQKSLSNFTSRSNAAQRMSILRRNMITLRLTNICNHLRCINVEKRWKM